MLLDYINSAYGKEYETADLLLSKNRITLPYVKYLFKPGDVLVEGNDTNIRGFVSKSWPVSSRIHAVSESRGGLNSYDIFDGYKEATWSKSHYNKTHVWDIGAWSWTFNGTFKKVNTELHLNLDADDHSEKNIADLNVRPLIYISESQAQHLKRRGETFWKCRSRKCVSYQEEVNRDFQNSVDDRYMIDLRTYQELHPECRLDNYAGDLSPNDLDDKLMGMETPPQDNFTYLLPLTIKGYNLQRKKWVDLKAGRITEVVWNKEAFKSLVLDRKTKDLIQALLSNQLAAEKSTDLIAGKGNGLILLLHGGQEPGKPSQQRVLRKSPRSLFIE